MHPTRNDLLARTRVRLEKLLNERLADAMDLEAASKQAHWNVQVPNSIALHGLFAQLPGVVEEQAADGPVSC
jgi:starvation-inducible DNA-binding protein